MVVKLKKLLSWIWLFPMNLLGHFNKKHYIGEYRDVKVYRWKKWVPGFATAFGNTILFDEKHEFLMISHPEHVEKLLEHEYQHIRQQRKYGAILFLLKYGIEFCFNFLFKPHLRFDWYLAYKSVSFEKEAREVANRYYNRNRNEL